MVKTLLRILIAAVICGSAPLWAKRRPKPPHRSQTQIRRDLKVRKSSLKSDAQLRECVKVSRGDVYINGIPMINQGNEKNCVPTTLRRLLEYYGRDDVNKRALQEVMRYDKSQGTRISDMVKAIQKYSGELRLKCQIVYSFMKNSSEIKAALKDYNKRAEPRRQIAIPDRHELSEEGFVSVIKRIDFEVWERMRRTDNQRNSCLRMIKQNIKRGVPVVWCVYLGLAKENGKKLNPGAHMRIIIGFNEDKNEIIYTDSWGNSYARERMSWPAAWAITSCLMVVESKN